MNKRLYPLLFILLAAVILVLFLSSRIFYTIQPGHAAVLFKPFGGGLEKEQVYLPGFHVVAPWNNVIIYDVREQTVEEQLDVLDKSGLSIKVDVSVRFNPSPDSIGAVHARFGQAYVRTLVVPEIRSNVRQVMGRYTAEEIYSTKRAEVESAIIEETRADLSNHRNNIQMSALLVRSIQLPEQIKKAIENKLQQEQESLAYQFRLEKEKSEAERKRIAAEGEAQANQIVNSSLTPNLLRMRGIEATQKLAESENAKVVVIGSGDDGLPIILGNN